MNSRRPRVTRSGDNDSSSSSEETLDDLDTDRTFTDTSHESVLAFEGDSGSSNLLEDVEVERSELARVRPAVSDLPLEVEKKNLVFGERGRLRNSGRTKEFVHYRPIAFSFFPPKFTQFLISNFFTLCTSCTNTPSLLFFFIILINGSYFFYILP